MKELQLFKSVIYIAALLGGNVAVEVEVQNYITDCDDKKKMLLKSCYIIMCDDRNYVVNDMMYVYVTVYVHMREDISSKVII